MIDAKKERNSDVFCKMWQEKRVGRQAGCKKTTPAPPRVVNFSPLISPGGGTTSQRISLPWTPIVLSTGRLEDAENLVSRIRITGGPNADGVPQIVLCARSA